MVGLEEEECKNNGHKIKKLSLSWQLGNGGGTGPLYRRY